MKCQVLSEITGWAKVNGRNAIRWEEKFKLDVYYGDHFMKLGLKVLIQTLGRVYRQRGIARDRESAMPEFMGEPLSSSSENVTDGREVRENIA